MFYYLVKSSRAISTGPPSLAGLPLPAYQPDHLSGFLIHKEWEISSWWASHLDAFSAYLLPT